MEAYPLSSGPTNNKENETTPHIVQFQILYIGNDTAKILGIAEDSRLYFYDIPLEKWVPAKNYFHKAEEGQRGYL